MDDQEIEALSREIRKEFINFKSINGRYVLTDKSDNIKIWKKAAKLCDFFYLKPKEMVGVIYDYCEKSHQVMMQHYLVGYKAEQLYRKHVEKRKKEFITSSNVKKYVDDAINFAAFVLHKQPDIEYAINSFSNAIEPWVRIYLAESLPNRDEVLDTWGHEAKRILDENPVLKQELKDRHIELNFKKQKDVNSIK